MSGPLLRFWIVAGAMTLATVMALLWPLAARRTAPAGALRAARARRVGWGLAVAVPLLACSLYLAVGAPRALLVPTEAPAHRLNETDMASAVDALAQRLKAQPDDLQGWFMLARSYQAMERWGDAAAAYRETVRLAPDEPQMLADLADVLATQQGGNLEGEPRALVERALALEAGHPKSLALLAIAEFRLQRYEAAIAHWERLLASQPADSEGASVARRGIEQARGWMAQRRSPAADPAAAAPP